MTVPLEPGDPVEVVVEFTCPFCGGRAMATRPEGVMHVEPPCATFLALDPLAFLRAVNILRRATN